MVTQVLYLAVLLMIELLYWTMLLRRDYQLMNQKNLIDSFNGKLQAIYVSFDRMEVGDNGISAIKQISELHGVPVFSIINIQDIIEYLSQNKKHHSKVENIKEYIKKYS